MKLVVITKGDGPEMREALEFSKRIREEGHVVENYDFDAFETGQTLELYDIYSTPTALVVGDDGKLVEIWQGTMPLESEVKNLLRL